MESDTRNAEKEEFKPTQSSNERPKSLDLDSSSRSSLTSVISDKKEAENNESTRWASSKLDG